MTSGRERTAFRYAHAVERGVLWALLLILLAVAGLATIQLIVDIVLVLGTREGWVILTSTEVFFIFEALFLVLIALELLETVVIYLKDHVFHVGGIVLVAITAIARKLIVLNLDKYEPLAIIGLAAVIIALAGGYWLIAQSDTITCDWGDDE